MLTYLTLSNEVPNLLHMEFRKMKFFLEMLKANVKYIINTSFQIWYKIQLEMFTIKERTNLYKNL